MKHVLVVYGLIISLVSPIAGQTTQTQAPSPTPTATTTTPPATTITTPPASDITNIARTFDSTQTNLETTLKATNTEIVKLKKEIDDLRAKNDTKDLQALLAKTNERIDKIEEFNKQAKLGELKLDKLRYEAGERILVELIRDSGQLTAALSLNATISNYHNLTNPTLNPVFKQEFDALASRSKGENAPLLQQITSGGPLSALAGNPYVSLAFSVGSLLFSDLGKNEKKDRVGKLACILDYSTTTATDLRYIENTLANIAAKSGSFQKKTEKKLSEYGSAVGFTGTWGTYSTHLSATAQSPFIPLSDAFFNDLSKNAEAQANIAKDTTPERLAALRFQIEGMKGVITEYEDILKEVDDFFLSLESIINRSLDRSQQAPACTSNGALNKPNTDLANLQKAATDAHANFRKSFTTDFIAPSRRILYGIN